MAEVKINTDKIVNLDTKPDQFYLQPSDFKFFINDLENNTTTQLSLDSTNCWEVLNNTVDDTTVIGTVNGAHTSGDQTVSVNDASDSIKIGMIIEFADISDKAYKVKNKTVESGTIYTLTLDRGIDGNLTDGSNIYQSKHTGTYAFKFQLSSTGQYSIQVQSITEPNPIDITVGIIKAVEHDVDDVYDAVQTVQQTLDTMETVGDKSTMLV